MTAANKKASAQSNELKLVRVYDAPVKAVWDAWVEPEQVAQWWGPRGFTITSHSKDVRTGGHWNYTMHGPDGVDYPNKTTYIEVEHHKKMVYDHGANDTQPALFRVTVLFSEAKGKTTMDFTMTFESAEKAAEIAVFIKKAGGNATWDRLGEYLDKQRAGKEVFVINRSFNAPIETIFDMWTDPKHVVRWTPPTGFEMEFIRADIREGKSSFYKMFNKQGVTMYGRAMYHTIRKPDCLIYSQQFCDAQENISRHPMAPTWPETMHTTITFASEGPQQTRVTITWTPCETATAEEISVFIQAKTGMTMGWTGSFDKLEAIL